MKRPWRKWWRLRGKDELRNLVWSSWDPIDLRDEESPRDEYDSYLLPLARLLAEGRPVEDVADYLGEVRTGAMGLDEDRAADLTAAREFVAWYTSPTSRRARAEA